MRVEPTYDLAMAAAKDAAERQRRAQGRTTWSADDYNLAVDTFVRVFGRELTQQHAARCRFPSSAAEAKAAEREWSK